jgi:hypothetical protein
MSSPPKPNRKPDPTGNQNKNKRLRHEKYFSATWHFSFRPFVRIEVGQKKEDGPATHVRAISLYKAILCS